MRKRPVDDPLLFQLADPRRARPRLKDALWVRIIDVPGALAGRRYSGPVDVVIEVRDDLLPANAGRWRLTTAGRAVTAAAWRLPAFRPRPRRRRTWRSTSPSSARPTWAAPRSARWPRPG